MSRLRSSARAVASSSVSSTLGPGVPTPMAGRVCSTSARAAANCCAAVRASSDSRRALSSCACRCVVNTHTDTTPQEKAEVRRMIILEPRAKEQVRRASELLAWAFLLLMLAFALVGLVHRAELQPLIRGQRAPHAKEHQRPCLVELRPSGLDVEHLLHDGAVVAVLDQPVEF